MEKGPTADHRERSWRRAARLLHVASAVALIAAIVVLGGRQMRDKIAAVRPVQFIGHSDDAAYALMGGSLAAGRGISVPYISTFFLRYPAPILHREDHWPPFMGLSIAPLFYFFGKQAWIARLPAIFYGSIGLPLMTALLTWALSRRGYAALLAALIIMTNLPMYEQSERTLSDVATAMLVAGFCASVVLSGRQPWMHLLAGAFAAGAYFAKGSELYLLALYPLLALLCGGASIFQRGWVYAGMATALFLIAPYLYGNWRDYGNPVHSTQTYVSGFFGLEDWENHFYYPYWGHDLPKVSDRWEKHPREYPQYVRHQLAESMEIAMSGGQSRGNVWRDFGSWGLAARRWILNQRAAWAAARAHVPIAPLGRWESPVWEVAGLSAAGLLGALAMAAMIAGALAVWNRVSGRWSGPVAALDRDVRLGPVLAVWIVLLAHMAFLSFFWDVEARFCFPLLPLLLALGCTAATRFIEWPVRFAGWLARTARDGWRLWRGDIFLPPLSRRAFPAIGPALATLVFAAALLLFRGRVYAAQQRLMDLGTGRPEYPFSTDNRYVEAGEWIAAHLPQAIIMCRNPWELQFTMGPGNRSVGLPAPAANDPRGAEKIFAIARYYHVTHLLLDDSRSALRPYVLQHRPGLTRVAGAPMPLFELDWGKLPPATVEELFPSARASAPAK